MAFKKACKSEKGKKLKKFICEKVRLNTCTRFTPLLTNTGEATYCAEHHHSSPTRIACSACDPVQAGFRRQNATTEAADAPALLACMSAQPADSLSSRQSCTHMKCR